MAEGIVQLKDDDFGAEISKGGVCVVDCWAPWCAPCLMMGPEFEAASQSVGDTARFYKLNVDEAPKTAASFGIMSIPTLLFFKEGKEAGRFVGVRRSGEIVTAVTEIAEG